MTAPGQPTTGHRGTVPAGVHFVRKYPVKSATRLLSVKRRLQTLSVPRRRLDCDPVPRSDVSAAAVSRPRLFPDSHGLRQRRRHRRVLGESDDQSTREVLRPRRRRPRHRRRPSTRLRSSARPRNGPSRPRSREFTGGRWPRTTMPRRPGRSKAWTEPDQGHADSAAERCLR